MLADIENLLGTTAENDIPRLESILNLRLPQDYRQFLLKYNGGIPAQDTFVFPGTSEGSCVDVFYGIGPDDYYDLANMQRVLEGRLPKHFLAVAGDPFGNKVCICVAGEHVGKIYYWDHEREADPSQGDTPDTTENVILIADSFKEFLASLYELQTEVK
jgi:hypothetical protein